MPNLEFYEILKNFLPQIDVKEISLILKQLTFSIDISSEIHLMNANFRSL